MCNHYMTNPNMPNAARVQAPVQQAPMMRTVQCTLQRQPRLRNSCTDENINNPQYIREPPNNVPMGVIPTGSVPISVQSKQPETPKSRGCTSPLPESLVCYEYIPGFLRAHVGDLVRVEFLMYDAMTDRVGILSEVGASYIVLESLDGSSSLMCDLFSIKFVTIMQKDYADYASVQAVETSRLGFKG